MDNHNRANIVHHGSGKPKRVTRSGLTSELFAMVNGFEVCSTMRISLNKMFGKIIPLKIYTDSWTLYDCMTNINRIKERRLLIDLCMLRESYERRKINEVVWIPTQKNNTDAFTKSAPCAALSKLMSTNRLDITPNVRIDRSKPDWA